MYSRKEVLSNLLNDDLLSQCIHCGLCLSVCPTYVTTNLERSSPRGRLRLIKEYADDKNKLGNIFEDEMDFCLGCRACETACPAGVKYDVLHNETKYLLSKDKKVNLKKILIKFFLNKILANPSNLKLYSRILRTYQQSWFRKMLHSSNILKNISSKLFLIDELTPQISKISSDEIIDEITLPISKHIHNVTFHVGCIMNVGFAEINLDTIEVLKKSSCKITTPKNQYCCGALHAHNGELKKAKELAKNNIDLFRNYEYEYLISNSAGCGTFMKEYYELLKDDKDYLKSAEIFSSKIRDISEFIYDNDIKFNSGKFNDSVTYHDACHLVHGQGIFEQPRQIINDICDKNFREMHNSTFCCGSAGIYNILRQNDSQIFLDQKMQNIIKTNADVVITGNPGCIMQLRYGVKKNNLNLKVKHTVSFINEQKGI